LLKSNICGGAKPFGSKKKVYTVGGGKVCAVTDYGKQEWDLKPMSEEQKQECIRVSKNQIFFGGNFFNLPPSPCWIVWHKDNTGNFADCELAWTSFKTAVRYFKWRWNGMLQEDMAHKETRQHPTQKPVHLMHWILRKYSKENDLVLDSFMGSGTTGVACAQLGRKFIGIEIHKPYFDIAVKKIENEVAQYKLF